MTDNRVTPEGYCWKCMGRKVPTYELADGYDCNVITSDIHICRNCLVEMVAAIDRVVQPNAVIGTPEMVEQTVVVLMGQLPDDKRLEVMSRFCKGCGCDHPRCYCGNDE